MEKAGNLQSQEKTQVLPFSRRGPLRPGTLLALHGGFALRQGVPSPCCFRFIQSKYERKLVIRETTKASCSLGLFIKESSKKVSLRCVEASNHTERCSWKKPSVLWEAELRCSSSTMSPGLPGWLPRKTQKEHSRSFLLHSVDYVNRCNCRASKLPSVSLSLSLSVDLYIICYLHILFCL